MATTTQLGDITITQIVEQQAPLFDALTFLPNLTPELLVEHRHWLAPDALDPATGKLILAIQSYLVRTPHHTILVDTCVGNDKTLPAHPFWHQQKSTGYMRQLAEAGVSVDDIDYVMCTHLHVDHVGWNTRLENGRWVPTFPKAKYLFTDKELAYWTAKHAETPNPIFAESVLPIVSAGRTQAITSSSALNDHIRLEPTPGHTPDHYAVQLGRGTTSAVLSGDLIHSPIQMRFPHISMRADTDQTQSAQTRRRFLECYCDTETLMCTAHFPSPSKGKVRRWADGFKLSTE
jgi:glyoxylase-like metal-dependent hydrolase (beta-lactamase superfamily II)